MKRTIRAVVCALLLCCALLTGALAEGETAAIDRYEAKAVVDAHGAVRMTVTVDMTIPTALTRMDFPIGAGEDGAVAGLTVKTVQTEEGTALRLQDEAGISGSRTFVITYTLRRAISDTDAGQKLALELIAPGWAWPMTAASFSVTMPADFTEAPVYLGGYYGDTVDDYLDLQCDRAAFSGSFTEPLRDHDALSVTLSLPAAYADLQSARGISPILTAGLVVLIALLCAVYWYKTLYNPPVSVRLRPLPPDGTGAGDLPMLTTCRKPSLPLQAMQWAAAGYLAIHINPKGRIVLRKTMPMGTERRKQERAAFDVLFEKNGWCDGESLRFGRLAGRYAGAMRAYWNRRLFSKTSGSPRLLHLGASLACGAALLGSASAGLPVGRLRGVFLCVFAAMGVALGLTVQYGCMAAARRQYRKAALCGIALVALLTAARIFGGMVPMMLAAALQAFAVLTTRRGGRRSPGGRDNLAQTLGFQRYLLHVTQHQLVLLLRDDSQYFYHMLPFAEAVGLGREFAERFGEIEMEPCAWFETQRRPATTGPTFYQQFRDTLVRMETAQNR